MSKLLNEPATNFRAETAKGFRDGDDGDRISTEGGKFGFGIIKQFAVITRGEALGHGMWIDAQFVSDVTAAMQASKKHGLKSRYTHPGMSSDGLSKHLGRTIGGEQVGDIAYSDLHFAKSSTTSPDGDLRQHVIDRAEEDPDSFGSSIVFIPDYEAEDEFAIEHQEEHTRSDRNGNERTSSRFKSPDPDNVKNLRHARLASLECVDIVDEPAANAGGMFQKDSTYSEACSLIDYVLELSDDVPELTQFGVHPDRAKSFTQRILKSKGLQIVPTKKDKPNESKPENDETNDTELGKGETEGKPSELGKDAKPVSQTETPPAKPETDLSGRDEFKKFQEKFGNKAGEYFGAGLSYEYALEKHIEFQADDNKRLSSKVEELSSSDSESVSGDGDQGDQTKRKGFASNINVPELQKK